MGAVYPIGRTYTDLGEFISGWAVIDMDSGSIVGTNLALVEWPRDRDTAELILNGDEEARDYGRDHGYSLYAPVRLEGK